MLHQQIRLKALGVVLFSATLLGLSETAVAADTLPPGSQPVMNQTVTGLSQTVTLNPTGTGSASQPVLATAPTGTDPVITTVTVTGEVNPTATGTAYYDTVKIALTGQHLTNDNFLTAEGLHWSDETKVEVITGEERGILNDPAIFGAQNTPIQDVTAYSIAVGNKGRITHVGKTVSGLDLDLLWTITETDSQDWQANSGMGSDARVKGIGFAGEQTIPNTRGNSIVVLYNEANMVGIHYQIVKHGTLEEVPVILSFITTDIDGAQGVKTNLANLTQLVPSASDLAIDDDGVIYDASTGGPYGYGNSLNGSAHLPKGGYLGAGFVSHFDYTFYSPAPARQHDTYSYSPAVRYDIFGSSLQANVETTVKQLITVHYQDNKGVVIKSKDHYEGVASQPYLLTAPTLEGYAYKEHKVDTHQENKPVVTFIYQKEHALTINYVDEAGKVLKASERLKKLDGEVITLSAPAISGYQLPQGIAQVITGDMSHTFVYKKPASTQARPVQTYQLTFTYVDDTGKTLAPSKTITKTAGDSHRENPVELVGYNRPESYQIQVTGDTSHVFVYSPLRTVSPSQPNPSRPSFFSPTTVVNQLGSPALYQPQLSPNASWQIVPVLPQGGWVEKLSNQKIKLVRPAFRNLQLLNVTTYLPTALTDNIGFYGDPKVFIENLKSIRQKAEKRFPNDKNAVNREIAKSLAHSVYARDGLQPLLVDYRSRITGKRQSLVDDLMTEGHKADRSPVDFSHIMTTLASLEMQNSLKQDMIRDGFVLPLPISSSLSDSMKRLIYNMSDQKTILLQLNSLIGDTVTISSKKDIYSDMDAVILHAHPAYKTLPLDERIVKYYSQPDLYKRRSKLFSEVYSDNETVSKTSLTLEMINSTLTFGGLLAVGYGLIRKGPKQIANNLNLLDDVVYDGGFKKFMKDPIGVGASYVGDLVKYGIDKTVEDLRSVSKEISRGVNKHIVKPATNLINTVKTRVLPTAHQVIQAKHSIAQKVTNNIQRVKQVADPYIQPIVTKIKSVPNHPIVKPVVTAAKAIVHSPVVKPVVATVKTLVSAVTRTLAPKKRGKRK